MSIYQLLKEIDYWPMDIKELRIAALRRVMGEMTQKGFAELYGLEPSYISQLLNGHRSMGEKAASKLEDAIGLPAGTLVNPQNADDSLSSKTDEDGSPHEDDYALIPQLTARAAAGNGHFNDHIEVKAGMAFKREWMAKKKLRERDLAVIYVDGQSMEPKLFDGDVLLIDTSKKTPMHGRVFALRRPDGDISIKRLFQASDGTWDIVSDNPDKYIYRTEKLDETTAHEQSIIGMAVWHGGDV